MTIVPRIERRAHHRAYVPIVATIRSKAAPSVTAWLLRNLSEGGALVSCPAEFAVSESIFVALQIPEGDELHLNAVVSRIERLKNCSTGWGKPTQVYIGQY